MAKNQCDGCARGLTVEDGVHYSHMGTMKYVHMLCTADRYQPNAPFPPAPHAEIPGARTTDNGECNIAY
jgi:hypothetical protein